MRYRWRCSDRNCCGSGCNGGRRNRGRFAAVFDVSVPAADLLTGILLQAKKLIGRDDGGLLSYYVLLPSLPAWGLLLLGTAALAASKRPMLLLIARLAWYFGRACRRSFTT